MPFPGGGGSGGLIQASPSKVSNSSVSFLQGSLSVQQTLLDINSATQQLLADLFLISELSRFASALENYQARMQTSMDCLLNALGDTGQNLLDTAETFLIYDTTWTNIFQGYPGFESGLQPGLNMPGVTSPGLFPQTPWWINTSGTSITSPSGWPKLLPWNTGGLNLTPNLTSPSSPFHLGSQNIILGGP